MHPHSRRRCLASITSSMPLRTSKTAPEEAPSSQARNRRCAEERCVNCTMRGIWAERLTAPMAGDTWTACVAR